MAEKISQEIVVVDRGWVFVGRVKRGADAVLIEDAKTVRRWGTSRGLGQLALEGAQPNTVLDPVGTISVPARAVIFSIVCQKPI
ncbi:MAG: hypothetical protein KGL39_27885 [Patescibacteria group bacterium]|nr:hypothetical protein [Patescibacteria group bacterium]